MKKLKLYSGDIKIWHREGSEYIKELYLLNSYSRNISNGIPNFIFKSSFAFQCFSRGRSSAVGEFKSFDIIPFKVNMFLTDIQDCIIKEYNLNCLEGYFCFTKRGQNIALKYLGQELPESNLEYKELNLENFKGD